MTTTVDEQSASETVREDIREYGLYTIENRALPDVRDGLKPVQRLLLWTLWQLKKTSKAIPAKCTKIAGDCIGNYHPHGDAAAYDALVNLRWQRYPLVTQEGNFGDPNTLLPTGHAAPRYTEAKLAELSERFFDDIHVVDKEPNYTGELEQPLVLPSRIPLLLVNGAEGIAMSMATKFPAHNLTEILNAAEALLDDGDLEVDDLLKYVKGPDAGGGVLVSKKKDYATLYQTGKGKVQYSCTYEIEEGRRGAQKLVITGKAPGFNGSKFLKETLALRDKKLIVAPAIDESSLETGTRITVEFKDQQVVRDRLLPLLNTSASYQMYALDPEGNPRLYNLRDMLSEWLDFRRDIEEKVLRARRDELKKKLAVDNVKSKAILQIDDVVKIIKSGKSKKSILKKLCTLLSVETWLAEVIWNTSLGSLARMNLQDVKDRIKNIRTELKRIKIDLSDIDGVVKRRIDEVRKAYGDSRGTRLRKNLDDLQSGEDATYYVGVTSQGKIESFPEAPTKSKAKWPYVDLVHSQGNIVLVHNDNTVLRASLSYLDRMGASSAQVVGVASGLHDGVLVVSRQGKYVYFSPEQKRDKFNAFRGLDRKDRVYAAVGVRPGDAVYVCFEDKKTTKMGELTIKRPNTKPKNIRRSKGKVAKVIVRRPGDTFVATRTFEEVSVSGVGRLKVWRVGNQNIVIDANGTRRVKTQGDVLAFADKKGKPKRVVPLDTEE